MLVRVTTGSNGIVDYLENGIKSGRELSRDELDERICIDGNLDITDEIIKDLVKSEREENYYHITLSFAERDIDQLKVEDAYNQFKEYLLSAYKAEEFNCYAEIHYPKVKSYTHKRTGESIERFPHVHMVLPKVNLLTDKDFKPVGFYKNNVEWFSAIQEKINQDNKLISPLDRQRNLDLFDAKADIISRYKGDDFKGANKELKRSVLNDVVSSGVKTYSEFESVLSKYGQVAVGNQGRPDEYLKVKPAGDTKYIRLKEVCFSKDFIENREKNNSKPLLIDLNRKVKDWVNNRSLEVKYIHSASPKVRKEFYSLSKKERKEYLSETARKYYSSSYPNRYEPEETRGSRHISQDRRKSDSKPSINELRLRGSFTQTPVGLPSMSELNVDITRRRENGTTNAHELLHDNAKNNLQRGRTDHPARLRRSDYGRSRGRSGRGVTDNNTGSVSFSKNSMANRTNNVHRPKQFKSKYDDFKSHVSLGNTRYGSSKRTQRNVRFRNLVNDRNSSQIVFHRRQKSELFSDRNSHAQSILREYHRAKYGSNVSGELDTIRQDLKATFLLSSLSDTYGLRKDNYKVTRDLSGRDRIQTNLRSYNVTDFCTQYMHLSWQDSKKILQDSYRNQIISSNPLVRNEQYQLKSLVYKFYSSDAINNRGLRSDHILKYLQRKEKRQVNTMEDATEQKTNSAKVMNTQNQILDGRSDSVSYGEMFSRLSRQKNMQEELHNSLDSVIAKARKQTPGKQAEVEFFDKNSGDSVFLDRGKRIVMADKEPSAEHTAAALQIASEKFGRINITGTKEFKEQVLDIAVSKNINVVFADKEMQRQFVEMKQAFNNENSQNSIESVSANKTSKAYDTTDLSNSSLNVKNQSNEPIDRVLNATDNIKQGRPTIVDHGDANYLFDNKNSKSYFVKLSDGNELWGAGLKEAMESSRAKVGDAVDINKTGNFIDVQVPKKIFNTDGSFSHTEQIKAQKAEWKVDVIADKATIQKEADRAKEEIKVASSIKPDVKEAVKGDAAAKTETVSRDSEVKAESQAKSNMAKAESKADAAAAKAESKADAAAAKAESKADAAAAKPEVKADAAIVKSEVKADSTTIKAKAQSNVMATNSELKASATDTQAKSDASSKANKIDVKFEKRSGSEIKVTVTPKVDDSTLDSIRKNNNFLRHYSIDEVKSGTLDRKKAGMDNPINRSYDSTGKAISANKNVEKTSAKL